MSYEQSVAGLKKEVQAKVMGNLIRNPFFAFGQLGFASNWTVASGIATLVGTAGTPDHLLTMQSGAIVESDWITIGSGQDSIDLPLFTLSLYAKCTNTAPLVLKVELVDSMTFVAASANFTPGTNFTLQSLAMPISPSATRKLKVRITAPVGITSIGLISLVPGDVEPSFFSAHAVSDEELYEAIGSLSLAIGSHTHVVSDINGLQTTIDAINAAAISETNARILGDAGTVTLAGNQTVHDTKTFDGALRAANPPLDNVDVVRKYDIQNSNVEPYASMGHYTSFSTAGNAYAATPVPFIERFHSGVNIDYNSTTHEFTVAKAGIYRLSGNMLLDGRISGNANTYYWIKIKPGGTGSWTTLNQDISINVSPGESIDLAHPTEWVGFLQAGDLICVMVNHDYYWNHLIHFNVHYIGQPAPTTVMTIVTGNIDLYESSASETYPQNALPIAPLVANNNQGPVVWTIVTGAGTTLPGAAIVGNVLSGDFAAPGSWTVTVQAVDSLTTVTKLLNVVLHAYVAVPLACGAPSSKTYNVYTTSLPYTDSIQFLPSGGTAPYGYGFNAGATTAPTPGVSGSDFTYVLPTGLAVGAHSYTARMVLSDTLTSINQDVAITVNVLTSGGGGGGGTGGCVPAGTMFTLADGTQVPIETVTPGMKALAFDDQTGLAVAEAVVNQTFKFNSRELWKIMTTVGEIVTSWDHRPWRVEDLHSVTGHNHFPRTEELKVGQHLKWVTNDGRLLETEILSVDPLGRTEAVYHVTLSKGHVYVAGGLAAHNLIKAQSF